MTKMLCNNLHSIESPCLFAQAASATGAARETAQEAVRRAEDNLQAAMDKAAQAYEATKGKAYETYEAGRDTAQQAAQAAVERAEAALQAARDKVGHVACTDSTAVSRNLQTKTKCVEWPTLNCDVLLSKHCGGYL